MKRKILSMISIVIVAFNVCAGNTLAAEDTISKENIKYAMMNEQREQEELKGILENLEEEQISEEEWNQINKEYINLEFSIPDDKIEIYEDIDDGLIKESKISTTGIATYASSYTGGVYYTGGTATSTTMRYSMSIALKTYYAKTTSSDVDLYKFGDKVVDSFVVPGMVTTNVLGENCSDMVPQGLVYASGYIFISAYCKTEAKEHNSVLYVIDASSREYITTLVLDGKPHAGGLAYANGRLWICDGGKTDDGYPIIHYYDMLDLVRVIEKAQRNSSYKSVGLSYIEHGKIYLKSQSLCSFMTSYNGYLYVGEYYTNQKGTIGCYSSTASDGQYVTAISTQEGVKYAQGIMFYETYSYVYMLLNSSTAYKNTSNAYVYRCKKGTSQFSYYQTIELPGMLEQSMIYNGKTYFIFESCSKYWGSIKLLQQSLLNPPDIVGKVCGLNNSFIFK